jgi:pimeloyl-ACP methyl ester carboxylesterase
MTTKTTTIPDILLPPDAAEPTHGPQDEFVMPCGISQKRFWVLDQLVAGNSALNIPLALELKGPLNVEALYNAIHMLIGRHETLRTSFAWVDDEVKQVIAPQVRFHFQQKDLESVPAELKEACLLSEMEAEAVRPLSLTTAPIFRARLLHLAEEHHALLLTFHHIICDGWSNGLLVRDLGVFYDAVVNHERESLPALSIQYADYIMWQREWLQGPDFRAQLAWWERQWRGNLRALDFPTDHPRKTGRSFPSTIESLLLSENMTVRLKQKCQELGVTIFMIFFAAYVVMLHRYSGQSRFMVGTTAANRTRPELENVVGQFANPMLLPCDLSDSPTFRELLARVHQLSLEAVSRQEVPFESIIEKLESDAGGRQKPVIQAHFLFQKAFMQPGHYGGLDLRPLRSVSPGTTFELMFGIVERGEGIRLQMEYNVALFEKRTIVRMLRHFRVLLENAVESLDTLVSEMPLLTEEERALAWSSAPMKVEGATTVNAVTVIEAMRAQTLTYFREAEIPQAAPVEAPPGCVLVVLDQNLRLRPFGVPGDVYLGGLSPETAGDRSLVTGPVDCPWPVPLLRTGFLGRMRDDGKVELLGEADHFVYVGGFRVNALQVTSLLARHPDVTEAAAAVVASPQGEEQLVAYILPRAGARPTEHALRELLRGKVSDQSMPAQFLLVSSLPKDVSGEVVPELLPSPGPESGPTANEKVPLEAILYQQLIDIWSDLLKISNIKASDNFFTLGGTSFLALRMMLEVEKLSGRKLPLSLLLTGATIENLARHLVESSGDATRPLIAVQPHGSRQPLFFLHGDWAGGGFYTSRMAECLGPDQPFYALPPYRSGRHDVLTMEEMAAFHVRAIRELAPHGPYLLGGYCIGASVAREMARQLMAEGETITQLVLIDPPLWNAPWFRLVWPWVNSIGDLLKWDLQRKIFYFDSYCVSFSRWLRRPAKAKLVPLLRRLGIKIPQSATPLVEGPVREAGETEILHSMDYAVYFLAYRLYQAQPWREPATVYFPESISPARLAEVRRMSAEAPVPFTVELLPGDHHTCITKYTHELAEKLQNALGG